MSDTAPADERKANLFASVIGAFMSFATLTEVSILQGLIGKGMGTGAPAGRARSQPAEHDRDPVSTGH